MNELPEDRRYLRLRHDKIGPIRFTSQRDIARVLERLLRRVKLPVAWSEGFSPHPLLSFSLALPTGAESLAEYVDIRLEQPFEDLEGLVTSLSEMAPAGMDFHSAGAWQGSRGSLQEQVTSCTWEMEVVGMSTTAIAERLAAVVNAPALIVSRNRKGKMVTDDIRPAILNLEAATAIPGRPSSHGSTAWIRAELETKERGIRPQELITALDADLLLVRPRRQAQWMEQVNGRCEPLTRAGQLPANELTQDPGGQS